MIRPKRGRGAEHDLGKEREGQEDTGGTAGMAGRQRTACREPAGAETASEWWQGPVRRRSGLYLENHEVQVDSTLPEVSTPRKGVGTLQETPEEAEEVRSCCGTP